MNKSSSFSALFLIVAASIVASGSSTRHSTPWRKARGGLAPSVFQHLVTTAAGGQSGTQIYYGGGSVMGGSTNIYVVYYGNWASSSQNIVNGWLQHIGGSNLYNINITYFDTSGAEVQNVVNYNPTANSYSDNYSQGTSLTDANIQTIVSNAISGGHLPVDDNGLYFVVTSSDVSETAFGESFCGNFCGYHSPSTSIVSGHTIKYSFVGSPARCPSGCDGNIFNGDSTTPNGDVGADGAINVMFHELSETVSDPGLNAWGAGGSESGDLCAWNFGTWSSLPHASDGAHYNVSLASGNYLIQQMFQVSGTPPAASGHTYSGACAVSLPAGVFWTPKSATIFAYNTDPPVNRQFTLSNNTASTLTITSIDSDWDITANACGSTLAPLASCSLTLTFDPSVGPGVYTGTLSATDSASNSPQTAPLKATVRCRTIGCG